MRVKTPRLFSLIDATLQSAINLIRTIRFNPSLIAFQMSAFHLVMVPTSNLPHWFSFSSFLFFFYHYSIFRFFGLLLLFCFCFNLSFGSSCFWNRSATDFLSLFASVSQAEENGSIQLVILVHYFRDGSEEFDRGGAESNWFQRNIELVIHRTEDNGTFNPPFKWIFIKVSQ